MLSLCVDITAVLACFYAGIFQSIVRLSGAVWDHITQQVFLPPKVRPQIYLAWRTLMHMHASDVVRICIITQVDLSDCFKITKAGLLFRANTKIRTFGSHVCMAVFVPAFGTV